jgi:hypothetical protein
MSDPHVLITLDRHQRAFIPGDVLAAECRVEPLSLLEPKALEISVLWYTEGKGEEDLAVHYFNRLASDESGGVDLRRPYRFSTRLPSSPLSYEGVIVKIRWCVRARLFLARGREIVSELPFRLGHVPPATAIIARRDQSEHPSQHHASAP